MTLTKNRKTWLLWGLFALLSGHLLWYMSRVNQPFPISDGWGFVELFFFRALEGEATWRLFWSHHYTSPIWALITLITGYGFGLDTHVELIIGGLGRIAMAGALLWILLKGKEQPPFWMAGLLVIAALSLQPQAHYNSSLLATGNYGLLLLVVYGHFFSGVIRGIHEEALSRSALWAWLMAAFCFGLLARDIANLAYLASLTILGLSAFSMRRGGLPLKGLLKPTLGLLAVILLVHLCYLWIDPPKAPVRVRDQLGLFDHIWLLVRHIPEMGQLVVLFFANGMVELDELQREQGMGAAMVTGGLLLGLLLWVSWIYLKQGHAKREVTPLFLLLSLVFFLGGIIWYRYSYQQGASWGIVADRYDNLFSLVAVAWVWMLGRIWNWAAWRRSLRAMVGLALFLLVLSELYSAKLLWGGLQGLNERRSHQCFLLREMVEGRRDFAKLFDVRLNEGGMVTAKKMQKYEVNVFRPGMKESGLCDEVPGAEGRYRIYAGRR